LSGYRLCRLTISAISILYGKETYLFGSNSRRTRLTRLEPDSSLIMRVHTLVTPFLGLSLNNERSITAPSTVFGVFVILFFLLGSGLRNVGGGTSRIALR
jgi:hypothetical protein